MKVALILLLCCVAFGAVTATPLNDYINKPDPTYAWEVVSTIKGIDFTTYNIFLTSQTWLTANDSDTPVWTHWLQVNIPMFPDTSIDTALLYIDGGNTAVIDQPPTSPDGFTSIVCGLTGMVTAHLSAIPCEPITFQSDPLHESRTEDAIIAFTWAHFIHHQNQPNWLLRLPMTKAAVKALDTMQTFVETEQTQITPITKFVVAGASKRGWTTWMVGAVDKRVSGIVPIVAPVGNLIPQMVQQYMAYGEWSFALINYVQENVTNYLLNPEAVGKMFDIIGPEAYAEELIMPIFAICDVGDEFFMPNGLSFMWPGLWRNKDKIMRIVADAEHSLAGHQLDVMMTAIPWLHSLAKGYQRPMINWTISETGNTITAWVESTVPGQPPINPDKVIVWHAWNQQKRDFRLVICGGEQGSFNISCINPIIWLPETIYMNENSTWSFTMPDPDHGWVAFELEFMFNNVGVLSGLDPMKITTDVSIIPQTFPHPPCEPAVCGQSVPPANSDPTGYYSYSKSATSVSK